MFIFYICIFFHFQTPPTYFFAVLSIVHSGTIPPAFLAVLSLVHSGTSIAKVSCCALNRAFRDRS